MRSLDFSFLLSTRIQNGVIGQDFSNDTSSNSFTTFSEGESGSLGDGQWEVKFSPDLEVVSWLGNFNVFWEENFSSSIGSFVIELSY